MKFRVFLLMSSILAVETTFAVAGTYEEPGYIVEIQVEKDRECKGHLRYLNSNSVQAFRWKCDDVMGKNVLLLSQTALLTKVEVTITLEGVDEEYKELVAIQLRGNSF